MLGDEIQDEGTLNLVKLLFTETTLAVKIGKEIGAIFTTNIGVPQGDSISPKLFTYYLDKALKELDGSRKGSESDHTYCLQFPVLPLHMEYADDVDFITENDISKEELLDVTEKTFEKYNLKLNNDKTEVTILAETADLSNTKKLGTILDDQADIKRRNQLATIALSKYQKIWKNPYGKVCNKVSIYTTYVRSILTYNCSTWHANKGTNDKLDILHRKHLRRVLNIHYPKIISNDVLYEVTRTVPLSEFVTERRRKHLAHVLRRDTTIKQIYEHVQTLPKRKGKRQKPANLLKTFRKDFQTDESTYWKKELSNTGLFEV